MVFMSSVRGWPSYQGQALQPQTYLLTSQGLPSHPALSLTASDYLYPLPLCVPLSFWATSESVIPIVTLSSRTPVAGSVDSCSRALEQSAKIDRHTSKVRVGTEGGGAHIRKHL